MVLFSVVALQLYVFTFYANKGFKGLLFEK